MPLNVPSVLSWTYLKSDGIGRKVSDLEEIIEEEKVYSFGEIERWKKKREAK